MERLRRAVSLSPLSGDLFLTQAAVKTGRWKGVVAAFITMSDAKDEIDWEWPGTATTEGQSNYFWQGFFRTCSLRLCRGFWLKDRAK
jgi:hypothetical protein